MGSGGKDKADKTRKKPGRRPTACAECRRLKFRCDRNVPCEKCESRGCGSICPDGVLAAGKGNRLVLANTEELHDQIDQLCARNRELENALRLMQENVSDQPHPLLRTDILRIPSFRLGSSSGPSTSSSSKSPTTSRVSPMTHPPLPTETALEEDNIDAFGTLVIGQREESSFIGRTARAEYLINARHMCHRQSKQPPPHLPQQLVNSSFLEARTTDDSLISETLSHLPSFSEASRLCDVYSDHGRFIYSPIPQPELHDQVLAAVYQSKSFNSSEHFHALSLLFIILAIATLFDSNVRPYSTQAHIYYHLSRTSLSFAPPYQETTLASIQTLMYMAIYLDLSDSGDPDSAWMYIGHAVRLGHSIGLHLNSTRWRLTNHEIQCRNRVFWQLSVLDTWSSIYLGRPPAISLGFIDQPLPDINFDSEDSDGNTIHSWLIHYTSLLHTSLDIILGRRQPNYLHILEFDHKIRDFNVPVDWRMSLEDESQRGHRDIQMYRWIVLSSKEIILLNLHRPYFVQALQETPTTADLQRHRYLPSVVATYRSAWRLSRGLSMTWKAASSSSSSSILARLTLPWSHALSAATTMCILVTRAPSSHLTTHALEELDKLTSLFASASPTCRPASDLLGSVQTLCRQAHEVIEPHTRYYHHHSDPDTFTPAELDRLNGKTYLFTDDQSSPSTSSRSRATSVTISDCAEVNHPPHTTTTTISSFHVSTDNLHPTLAQDVQEFRIRSSSASAVPPPPIMTFHDRSSSSNSGEIGGAISDDQSPPPPQQPQQPQPPQLQQPQQVLRMRHTHTPPPPLPLPLHEIPKLFLQSSRLSEPQMDFFHQSSSYHVEPLIESRRMQMSYGSGVGGVGGGVGGFGGGGFGGGFGFTSTITLDSAWHGFAEQLGF